MTAIRGLGRNDLEPFIALRSFSFPAPGIDADLFRELMIKRLPHSRGLFVDGELACVVTMYPMNMYLEGQTVPMGGLAGVASAPQHRRRGHIRTLVLDGLERLHEEGVGWSLEYPFDPRFYGRLGWQSVPSAVDMDIPIEFLFSGRSPAAERIPLEEFESLAPIYDAWARRYNFSLTRVNDVRDPWKRLVSDWWLDEPGHLFRFEDAYLLFALSRGEGRTLLTVEDYAYESAAGRANILSFIGSMQGQVDRARIYLPSDDPVALDYGSRHSTSRWPLQARVSDVAAALEPHRSDRETSFRLGVRDDLCSWNDGVFRVETGPSGTAVERTDGTPDAELPVQTLPLLLAGMLPPRAAIDQGMAVGSVEALSAITAQGGGRTPFMPLSDAF